ncbi:hypothetical protein IW262DRAFT_1297874 [Armillaria fumosa]|nr:hypothetical protein IW262DRAFT_1297874 [Armillaria fumosa]
MAIGIAFSAILTVQMPIAAKLPRLGLGITPWFIAVIHLAWHVYYDAKATPSIFQHNFRIRPEQTYSIGVQLALGNTNATNTTIYASSSHYRGLMIPLPASYSAALACKEQGNFSANAAVEGTCSASKDYEEETVLDGTSGSRGRVDGRKEEQRCVLDVTLKPVHSKTASRLARIHVGIVSETIPELPDLDVGPAVAFWTDDIIAFRGSGNGSRTCLYLDKLHLRDAIRSVKWGKDFDRSSSDESVLGLSEGAYARTYLTIAWFLIYLGKFSSLDSTRSH